MTEKNYQEIIKSMRIGECRHIKPNFYFKIDNDYGIKTKQLHNKEYEFEIVNLNEKTEGDMIQTLQKNVIINNLKPEEIMANKSLCDALLKDDNFKTKLINNQEFVKQILIDQDKIQDIFNKCDSKEKEKIIEKIIEIMKSKNILNFADVSKYINAEEDFNKLYKKNVDESRWQEFFEKHLWVLGLSLQQQLLIPNKPSGELKQDDMDAGLMTSSNFRVIAEFKKDTESLLKTTAYRTRNQENNNSLNNCYNVSDNVSGGVIQVLQYKQSIKENFTPQKDEQEKQCYTISNFNPRCYLIIGNTKELDTDGKKECFELFRRNCKDVEIITYDEIYKKIKYVVDNMTDNKF